MNSTTKFILLLLFLSVIGQIANDIYLPSLPFIAKNLQSDVTTVQLTLTVFMIGLTVSQFFYGSLSDAFGRKIPFIIGIVLVFIGSLICLIANQINTLMIGRLIQGIGAGASITITRAMMRDHFSKEELARHNSFMALASIGILAIAPTIGGYLQQYFNWRANFLFLLIYSLISFLILVFYISESNQHRDVKHIKIKNILQNYLSLLSGRYFMGYALCPFFAFAAFVAWVASGPILLQKTLHLSPVEYGWCYFITACAFTLGALINRQVVKRFSINKMILFGIGILFLSSALLLLFYFLGFINVYVIVIPAFILVLAGSFIFPNSSAGAFDKIPHMVGVGAALFGGLQILGGVIASSLIAVLPSTTQLPMAIIILIASLFLFCCFYFIIIRADK